MAVGKNIRFDGHEFAGDPFGGKTPTVDFGFDVLNDDTAPPAIRIACRRFFSGIHC